MSPSRQLIGILWPAFLLACAMELLVFALVDPSDLHWGGEALRMSRQGVYTVAFFLFWGMAAASSAFTALLAMPPSREPPEHPQ
ncbi:hypothetical protein EH244_17735 [Variovorax beijingensis]|uniref:Transmembrane protein n=1 Tax=Variovorax beijingensis TaxID=2496117 RepID=A0A3P3EML4_9BURK|nr:hypothetical protein [Variovorax beijingensis]RRH87336.1 hypothetical protein EH244_17735 [Variovorax beijingensis]RSZ35626.1 hypothetical protein EJO66_16705 [Variovorax beijingensis]